MGDAELWNVVKGAPVTSAAAVLELMEGIDSSLPAGDGLRMFNRLYQRTSENVAAAIVAGSFSDGPWATQLVVVFANYYFSAIQRFLIDRPSTPRAWLPLFERRSFRDVAPIQFAVAGMNAHINRDHAFALFDLARDAGGLPARGSARHVDFREVNDILAVTMEETKPWLEDALLALADHAFGNVDDAVALFSVSRAREAAWTRGEVLWALRGLPGVGEAYADVTDRAAGLTTRAILVRTGLPLVGLDPATDVS
jgi:hypothetical protein